MSVRLAPNQTEREHQLVQSAKVVVRMAAELHDDLEAVWQQVATADHAQLREWLVIALAAIDTGRSLRELLGWVEQIPTTHWGAA